MNFRNFLYIDTSVCTLTVENNSSLSQSGSPTPYELAEGLEQLRFLEHGVPIHVVETGHTPLIGVDVPADLDRVKQILETN